MSETKGRDAQKKLLKREFLKRKILLLAGLIFFGFTFWGPKTGLAVYGAQENGEVDVGEEIRVFDYAGLFSAMEMESLQEEAVRLQKELKMEFIVLTIEDAGHRTAQENADTFYFSHGFDQSFDESGALVLIDMDNREIYLGTYGIMIRVITDQRLEDVLDAAWPEAVEGNYAAAASIMLRECENYLHQGIVKGQYNYDEETGRIEVHHTIRWYEALAAVMISACVGGLACGAVCSRYRMGGGQDKESRLAYQDSCKVQILPSSDQLLHTTVQHAAILRTHHSGKRSSGNSSARRSTTHSHSGHRAGGGGRKF